MILDIHQLGLHYSGVIDSMFTEEVFSFSSVATYQAYKLKGTSPYPFAGDKRLKLKALQEHFPSMGKYKGVEGV